VKHFTIIPDKDPTFQVIADLDPVLDQIRNSTFGQGTIKGFIIKNKVMFRNTSEVRVSDV